MDLLDSPLNLAHQQSRKAEKYIKSSRYEDAIECHRKAAEYLSKAMAATTIQQALESFSLQREHHIRQQALIREKQRRHLQAMNKSAGSHTTKPVHTEDHSVASSSSDSDLSTSDKRSCLKNLQESDSLLRFLNNRAARTKDLGPNREELPYRFDAKTEGTLTDKDDKTIRDELCCQNDALRNQVLELLKDSEESRRQIAYLQRELDFSRKENRDLKDRLSKTERSTRAQTMQDSIHSETFYSMPMALNLDNLPAMELPPLEMPKFDFEAMKTCQDEELSSQ